MNNITISIIIINISVCIGVDRQVNKQINIACGEAPAAVAPPAAAAIVGATIL